MKKIILALLVTVILTTAALVGCKTSTGVDNHEKDKVALQNHLDQQVKEQGILGMIMSVRLADGTIITKTSGYTDPSGKVPWTSDTVSALGSITKTFTAVVVMQLVEEGKLTLDDTVDTWFPEQPDGNRITIRMLLSHTSGIANHSTVFGMDADKWTKPYTPQELIAEANKFGPVAESGSTDAYYSNTGYHMLGLIIEGITGNSWEQEVALRIIKPLNLKSTTFLRDNIWDEGMILGYAKTSDGYMSSKEFPWYPHVTTAWAAGAIVSSTSDLMTFATALFDGGLVSKETLAIMAQPLGKDVETGILWGLGGGTLEEFDRPGFGMGGDVPGFHAFFVGYLDSKHVVIALVNTEEGDVIGPSLAALQYISQE